MWSSIYPHELGVAISQLQKVSISRAYALKRFVSNKMSNDVTEVISLTMWSDQESLRENYQPYS
ncbi:hypothetical protein SAMN05216403_1094 [Nitrosospira multiformis ATCC 25196]|uniref:Antibiotic biosynthesis monooxygenase n=1 Tax=Nitrosospira multiformis (strain ATCC 25196 / NCIMB 11849 / C 71) TaxID=323848 RepID=A0A1H5USI4_NITMU|nr:hypothetical protein SAMN05216411_1104 [Nitrosospira multiformis]SEF78045.1 hypothetical protein SAMN05216403_1094 [Nitrosospira multiformis ATCC 25196]